MSTISRLTLDQYDRMIAAGIFNEDQRVEFIHGELRDMTPIGPVHEDIVDLLNEWSFEVTSRKEVRVRVQNSVGIPELDSAPEPDIVWVRKRSYAKGRPTTGDVLLVIEVADSSLDYDRSEKADLFATAGIKEFWVVNVPDRCVEVFRDPQDGKYRTTKTHRVGEEIRPLAQPEASLPISRLFAAQ